MGPLLPGLAGGLVPPRLQPPAAATCCAPSALPPPRCSGGRSSRAPRAVANARSLALSARLASRA
eukprot:1588021-Alexandrium_andersonii.AAC.1